MNTMKYSPLLILSTFIMISCSSPSEEEYSPYLNFQAELVDDSLISSSFPEGSISFTENIQHIGSKSFILYNVARCEIHLFAELDSMGGFERLYWIQYEGYLPSDLLPFPASIKPGGLTYNYSEDPGRETIGDKEFYVKTGLFTIDFTEEELNRRSDEDDSDFLNVARLLNQNGININSEVLSVRMVHLNEDKSDELMIIYYESLHDEDQRVKELDGEGRASANWEPVSRDLIFRAKEGMNLRFKSD